jgi:hypothetical protein
MGGGVGSQVLLELPLEQEPSKMETPIRSFAKTFMVVFLFIKNLEEFIVQLNGYK